MRTPVGRVFVVALALALGGLRLNVGTQSAPSKPAGDSTPTAAKSAAETFKNLQVLGDLKGAPSPELWDTMQVMAGSLSVSCNYCHVAESGPFDSDANKTKLIARDMIRMTRAINENNYGGRRVVTCNTCHHGNPHPNATPAPWNRTAEQIVAYSKSVPPRGSSTTGPPPAPSLTPTLPELDQVLASYRRAVGTQALKSIHVSGIAADLNRGPRPRDVYAVFPDKIAIISGTARQIVNGDRGWQLTPQGRTDLTPNTIASVKNFAALLMPVKFETSEIKRTVAGIETVGDRAYYVVESHPGRLRASAPANSYPDAIERLFFDVQTGLLYKDQVTIETPLGTKVEETSFEDYRTVGGLKLPYLIVTHFMEDENLFKISVVEANVDVPAETFEPADAAERKDRR
jgi:photosynthetic reaction center cytochrome c subunit